MGEEGMFNWKANKPRIGRGGRREQVWQKQQDVYCGGGVMLSGAVQNSATPTGSVSMCYWSAQPRL